MDDTRGFARAIQFTQKKEAERDCCAHDIAPIQELPSEVAEILDDLRALEGRLRWAFRLDDPSP